MPEREIYQFLDIADIREDVVVLKDGGLRKILMVKGINFILKSDEEKEGILFQFMNFLNSLDFSIQILVLSRRLNLTPYLDQLKKYEEEQKNELLKVQIKQYRQFIEEFLLKPGVIMTKYFFVVVPYFPLPIPGKKIQKVSLTEEEFKRRKYQLEERTKLVALGLRRCGLEILPLTTPELIELFWTIYHPIQAERGYYPPIPVEFLR